MIPVARQPEPPTFDALVRQPGLSWIARNGFDADQPPPPGQPLKACWRVCLPDLFAAYDSTCAYLAFRIEQTTGEGSVDHFLPKSRARLRDAYEWDNYRLACRTVNALKCDFEDVMDPFEVEPGMFLLELVAGQIYAGPDIATPTREKVERTISRLRLDRPELCRRRAEFFEAYRQGDVSSDYLRKCSPFVWWEANRQGLL